MVARRAWAAVGTYDLRFLRLGQFANTLIYIPLGRAGPGKDSILERGAGSADVLVSHPVAKKSRRHVFAVTLAFGHLLRACSLLILWDLILGRNLEFCKEPV